MENLERGWYWVIDPATARLAVAHYMPTEFGVQGYVTIIVSGSEHNHIIAPIDFPKAFRVVARIPEPTSF